LRLNEKKKTECRFKVDGVPLESYLEDQLAYFWRNLFHKGDYGIAVAVVK
jgi:hypothetical protein